MVLKSTISEAAALSADKIAADLPSIFPNISETQQKLVHNKLMQAFAEGGACSLQLFALDTQMAKISAG